MRKRLRYTLAVWLTSLSMLGIMGALMQRTHPDLSRLALATSLSAPPEVASVAPGTVVNTADATIAIQGAHFAAVISGTQILSRPTVLLGDVPLADVGWVSTTTLTSTVPAGHAVGIYDVTVQNADGLSDTLAHALTVRHATPVITAIEPLTGTYGQPLILTILGTHFVPTPTLILGTAVPLDVHYGSSTTLTATLPSSLVPGYYDVTVQNPGPGDVTDWVADGFTLYSPVPTLGGIWPPKTYNDMDTFVIITGTNFAPTPEVIVGEVALQEITWISMTQLTAEIPWGMVPGTYTLTVTNPDPGGYAAALTEALTMAEGFNTWTTGGPYGGNIRELIRHPASPSTVYAVVMNVGVFVSADDGETWEMILRQDWMTHIALDADDPDVIYIGGDGGLLRTLDAGATWEEILRMPPDEWTPAFNLYRPLAHPTAPCVVYAGKRTPDEPEMEPGGIYRSDDCGTTWTLLGSASTGLTDTHIIDLAFHPDNSDELIAGTQSGNIFRSDDGGTSWQWQARVTPRIEEIMVNPFGAHESWILTSPPQTGTPPPYVYKSSDLTTWTPVTVTDDDGNSGFVLDLTFVTTDTILAGMGSGVISVDGGATWSDLGWDGILPSDNATSFLVDPDTPQHITAGYGMGGVYKSTDHGSTWRASNAGLAGVIPYALAVAPNSPETLYAYTTQGLLKSQNGGRAWQSLGKLVGGRQGERMIAVDPRQADRVYLSQPCDGAFCLWISEDAGGTWREITTMLPPAQSGQSTVIDVLAPHPHRAGHILAGVAFYPIGSSTGVRTDGGIFASDDNGEHWTRLAASEPFSQVIDIVYDAVDDRLIYAGTQGSGLWKSTTNGATWRQLPIPGLAPPVGIESVATHPHQANVVLARASSYAETQNPGGSLYTSRDAGNTWTQLNAGTSDDGLIFAPPAPQMPPYMLYSGCQDAICRSMDMGNRWATVYGVPRPTTMVAGTDGELTVVYAASPGGMAAGEQRTRLGALDRTATIPGRGDVMGSGVYKTTLRPLDQRVYLPLALRQ